MTLTLNTTPAGSAATSGGQSATAPRPAASDGAAGFAAALQQTGREAREQSPTGRDAADSARVVAPAEVVASCVPVSSGTAASISDSTVAADATPSDGATSDATPSDAKAMLVDAPVTALPTTFAWLALGRSPMADVSGQPAAAEQVAGVPAAQEMTPKTEAGALDAAIGTAEQPAQVPLPVTLAVPAAVPSAGARAAFASLSPSSVAVSFAGGANARSAEPSTPATAARPLCPTPEPYGTPTRAEFLVRPTGSTKAEAVTIVQADVPAPTTVSVPGAATPTAPVAPAAPTASAVPAAPVPLTAQVAKPLFTLSGVKPGEHVLTINVTPENLGPLTVRAHVTGDNIRVELFAPTDLAREALRAILPDLRRDLAGGGLNAQLDLSSQNQASDARADAQASRQQRPPPGARDGPGDEPPPRSPRSFLSSSSSTIDVMA
ncbi:hypothetical protein GY21_04815 [Cryobacterium roopkundense]|uniref:Flagellar hook-length control protein FliK n=1 Tax=Cryobacterium roopkundense TaxID=1001240 RepID=A0A099JPC6_9MICO|nr:flagellar hook-length control protein FliK [Cryobacterium roopkundense]KGJ79492.1 hypothetical protein GY21_04815 [Cryobacterium roopkundense]MBB5640821.1 flagellar hook-length control protein FliK [Cryobacterium roopkundense]